MYFDVWGFFGIEDESGVLLLFIKFTKQFIIHLSTYLWI